jgi:hypothetical protein
MVGIDSEALCKWTWEGWMKVYMSTSRRNVSVKGQKM